LTGMLLFIPLAIRHPKDLSWPTSSNLVLVGCIGLLDTAAFIASALGFIGGHVAIVSVLASLYSAVTVLLAAIFLRERLHLLQWCGILILFVGVLLTHL
jgi:drug/metabolite transporter (DMT)-like permease